MQGSERLRWPGKGERTLPSNGMAPVHSSSFHKCAHPKSGVTGHGGHAECTQSALCTDPAEDAEEAQGGGQKPQPEEAHA